MDQLLYFGATTNDYDCGTYGSGGFNDNQCATNTSAPGTPDTGLGTVMQSPYFIGGVALILVAAVALVLLSTKRSHSK